MIERLDNTARGERAFSVRDQFPDQWYDLHNPDQSAHPLVVSVRTRPDDYPTNLTELAITDLLPYLVPAADEPPLEVELTLTFTPAPEVPPPNPQPTPVGGARSRDPRRHQHGAGQRFHLENNDHR